MPCPTSRVLEAWTAQDLRVVRRAARRCGRGGPMLVRSELRGYATHGMTRLASYVERLLADDFNPRPNMSHRAFPGGIVLDADGAMGQIAGPYAVRLGSKALRTKRLRAGGHSVLRPSGRARYTHAMAAEAGAFCMIGQRTPPVLAMEGFRGAAIGHNPIAFGCPLRGRRRSSSTSPAAWRRADTFCSPRARASRFPKDGHWMHKAGRPPTRNTPSKAPCCRWAATRASASP